MITLEERKWLIELGCSESSLPTNLTLLRANEVDESVMTQAILWAHQQIRVIIGMQKELMDKCNVSFPEEEEVDVCPEEQSYYKTLSKKHAAAVEKNVQIHSKQERSLALKELLVFQPFKLQSPSTRISFTPYSLIIIPNAYAPRLILYRTSNLCNCFALQLLSFSC